MFDPTEEAEACAPCRRKTATLHLTTATGERVVAALRPFDSTEGDAVTTIVASGGDPEAERVTFDRRSGQQCVAWAAAESGAGVAGDIVTAISRSDLTDPGYAS